MFLCISCHQEVSIYCHICIRMHFYSMFCVFWSQYITFTYNYIFIDRWMDGSIDIPYIICFTYIWSFFEHVSLRLMTSRRCAYIVTFALECRFTACFLCFEAWIRYANPLRWYRTKHLHWYERKTIHFMHRMIKMKRQNAYLLL